ncbi:MAG: pilin [Candidatus Magasanikbacteria bacterium]
MLSKKFLYLFLGIIISVGIMSAVGVFAQDSNYGLDTAAGAANLKKGNLPEIIGNVIGTALSMVSVVFFVLMIYGGILWMTDRGNEEQAKKALNTVFAAIIGIIIVMSAYAITNFVFKSVGGTGDGGGGGTTPTASLCGKTEGLKAVFTQPPGWVTFTCQSQTAAGATNWGDATKCKAWDAYSETTAGGCPGDDKCCTPSGSTPPPCTAPDFCTASEGTTYCACVGGATTGGTEEEIRIACAGSNCVTDKPPECDLPGEIVVWTTCMLDGTDICGATDQCN